MPESNEMDAFSDAVDSALEANETPEEVNETPEPNDTEEVSEVNETPEPEVNETPEPEGFDPILLNRAQSLGYSEEDLSEFGDSAEKIIDIAERKFLASAMAEGQRESVAVETEGGEVQQPSEAAATDLPDPLAILKEEGYEESDPTYKAMAAFVQATQQQMGQVREMLNASVVERESQMLQKEASMFFSGLPAEERALWGGKEIFEAAQDPRYGEDVKKLLVTMDSVSESLHKLGQNPTTDAVAKHAMRLVYGDKLDGRSQAQRAEKASKRQKSFTTPPSTRDHTSNALTEEDQVNKVGEIMERILG